ncbi:phosphate ABC transporter permease PstA [Flavonifractor sp. An82]|uniref:phosphate ABC transporter permease PstA n=1 Tax=Flavonifractor sp. An82 TaxID=1965660 RepID=UPI000B391534|nr:phosphate ABC transporter permease PstA [Flavonifractor sp. An82]OUN20309.1 phosphate ABC transporter, permease protein PstA [Flavonifractor sp. An82]
MKMQPLSGKRKAYDRILRFLLYFCAALTCGLLIFIIGYIFVKGLPHITWEFLSTEPSFIRDSIGILPNILNTVYLVVVTLIIILPLGVGAAIYLTEYATNRRLVSILEFATETLTGIPSIIFGLVGMLFFCQVLGLQASLLAGSLTLVIMTIPTIIRTTQESLKTVPQSYREAALGLGAGKWHMIRTVVLPSSVDGIVTGCILSVGRIVGESAALLFTAGMGMSLNNFFSSFDNFIHSSGASLTVALYVYARERAEFDVAFAIAAILMILTLLINLTAKLVGRKLKKN